MIAASEADGRQQRETIVGRRLAQTDTQTPLEMFPYLFAAHDPTAHAVADRDDVAPNGPAIDQVVKRGDAVQVRRGHADVLCDVAKALVGDPTAVFLDNLQRVDGNGLAPRVVRCLTLNFVNFFCRQHRSNPHRSTSANTKSRLPKITTKSEIVNPRDSIGRVWMCAKDGVRMRVRYETVLPSLTR